jgi:hypothetical protein
MGAGQVGFASDQLAIVRPSAHRLDEHRGVIIGVAELKSTLQGLNAKC